MKIDAAIKKWRKSQEISQAELARRLGVRQQSVGNWELGVRKPSVEALLKLEIVTQGEIQARKYAPHAFRLSA